MKLHKNWEVTPSGLEKLRKLSKEELEKTIKEKNLFGGFPTEYANKENAKIYGKINNSGAKKETGKADTSKAKKGNGKDNKEGSKSSK